jgi:hypothetical protein
VSTSGKHEGETIGPTIRLEANEGLVIELASV